MAWGLVASLIEKNEKLDLDEQPKKKKKLSNLKKGFQSLWLLDYVTFQCSNLLFIFKKTFMYMELRMGGAYWVEWAFDLAYAAHH
jgi:hypothetical protein